MNEGPVIAIVDDEVSVRRPLNRSPVVGTLTLLFMLVSDLAIDGISLVTNYRVHFNRVIRTSSYEALVAKLKAPQ